MKIEPDFPRPRWSTLRKVSKQDMARIERLRKGLRSEYGKWVHIAKEAKVHYNSLQRFASGDTKRPREHILSRLEKVLAKRSYEEN